MMKRRTFIGGLGATAVSSLAARGQQKLPIVGWLNGTSAQGHAAELLAFKRGLEDAGYVEGRNVAIEYRWAEGHFDRLKTLAADLIDRKVAVIAATGGPDSALSAKVLTTTTPIVFMVGTDPVTSGLVASLAHPGGNLTGATGLSVELVPKSMELLREVLPGTSTTAALINPTNANAEELEGRLQQAVQALGLQLHILHASTDQEIDSAFETLIRLRAGGLVIGADSFFVDRSELLAALSLRHAVPAIFQFRAFAAAGGLMSYGTSLTEGYKLAGVYVARILNGERPSDLPVQQSTKVDLIINMKTAKALGITVPLSLLGRADEVIE